ncbi:MAG: hypothetical protein NC299_02465 [Lachnospiraceae bacterium]|nr:hypothetical protein [Ruminococcus sp.]MCM1274213.1 hypothetical protein [Lachnospiraceae bacterium]
MKKLALIIIGSLLLTGCSDATELGNRAIIQAAAIDFNGNYRVSALLFSGGGSGGDTIDASQENVIKVSGEGETLAEAIDSISLIDGKKLYMAETKLLVLGSGFEKISAADALETLYFDMRCSLNMPVCCAESAEFLTDMQFTEGITSAEKPLALIENAHQMGVSPKTTLLDLLADSAGGRASLLPRLAPTRNGRGMTSAEDGKTAVLNGSRRLKNGMLNGYYDEAQTAALMLISGKSDRLTLSYLHNDAEKTCEAYAVRVEPDGKDWRVSAKFRTRNGGALPEGEQRSALAALVELVSKAA